jgi:NADH:ubiquinone oxidoreductase subunit 6 (subunit J)
VATTVNTDVTILTTALVVHVKGAIPVVGMSPVGVDRSDEDVVVVLMGAIVVLLLVDVNFDDDKIEAESRKGLLLVVEVLLVVVLLVVKASSWYISNAYTPPQSSRGAPWQT